MSKRAGDPGYAGGWCTHYRNPMQNDTCEAGVSYERWRDVPFGRRPCFLVKGQSKPDAVECEHLRCPTKDEIAAHDAWLRDRWGTMKQVLLGIAPWRKAHRGKSAAEVVVCPACGGRLHLSISAYNGHVHGRCETAGCVSWVE